MQTRISAIQAALQRNEAIIIISDPNRLYLTGFSSSAGTLFITKESAVFLIDFRYYEKAEKTISHCDVLLANKLYSQLQELIIRHGIKKVFVETSYITVDQFKSFDSALKDCDLSAENTINDLILKNRSMKSADEVDKIKQAQKITDKTFQYILNYIRPGKTEKEIMLEMEFYLRKQGSEGVSFDFIVVSGKNSSLPHGVPTNKIIENGDFVTMDFGAVIEGYRSDMTRTVAVGYAGEEQRRVYHTVFEAQHIALSCIKPGIPCVEIDSVARSYIYKSGFEGCFGHGLGHSVGIEIHEGPSFNTIDKTILKPGMILTVEPGIYLPDRFGVRIEDMVHITEDGYENLTSSSKDLLII
ncbi:MAG: aminopeptidase P family protein [Clostridia bacterium]|nr:aminopeptidase P family protein [Clostridia bacterium]